jgi:glycosyltransferase involved in cell wall biosynthesis
MPPRRALIVVNGLHEPSAIVRAEQYAPFFERSSEWKASFIARRSQKWVERSNRTNRPTAPLIVPLVHRPVAAYTRHWEQKREDEIVRVAADVDLVYLVKIPHLPLYQRLKALNKPVVVADFNDGLWLPAFQSSGWQQLDAILSTAHGVICENGHVADYARKHNATVQVVPDSPQLDQFDRQRPRVRRDPNRTVLGWIGSPENVGSLYRIWEPLEALMRRVPNLHLRVLGADRHQLPRFEAVSWSAKPRFNQAVMIEEALAFDIGLFPMFHTGDGLARGNLKAMIYMSAEAAVLCEDYGENRTLVTDGVNGALAGTMEQWLQKMEWLATDRPARAAIAARGLQTIRERFAPEVVFEELQRAFTRLADASGRSAQANQVTGQAR